MRGDGEAIAQLLGHCDGSKSREEILRCFPASRPQVAELIDEQVLLEGGHEFDRFHAKSSIAPSLSQLDSRDLPQASRPWRPPGRVQAAEGKPPSSLPVELIGARRSDRFERITEMQVDKLLDLMVAMYGKVNGGRSTPSAGAVYPLILHVASFGAVEGLAKQPGLWAFEPEGGVLLEQQLGPGGLSQLLLLEPAHRAGLELHGAVVFLSGDVDALTAQAAAPVPELVPKIGLLALMASTTRRSDWPRWSSCPPRGRETVVGPRKRTLAELLQPSVRRRHLLRAERRTIRAVERWRIIACSLAAIVLGCIYYWAAKHESTSATLLQQAAPGLIVVLLAYVGRYVFLERFAGRPVFARTRAPEAAAVYDSLNDITDLRDLLETARRMTVVAQYTWPQAYHEPLCSFFGGGGRLRLYLMDPSSSDLASRVARQIQRDGANPVDLQAKVRESIESLRSAYEQGNADYDQPWKVKDEQPGDKTDTLQPSEIEIVFVDHMINYYGLGFSWRNPRSSIWRDEVLIAFLHNHFPWSLPLAPGVYFDLSLSPSIDVFWRRELIGLNQLPAEKKRSFTSFQEAIDYVESPTAPPPVGCGAA